MYGYEIWLEGNMVAEEKEMDYMSECEAQEDAENAVYDMVGEDDNYEFDDYEIKIVEL